MAWSHIHLGNSESKNESVWSVVGNGQSCDAELASFYAKEELKEFKVLTMSHF